MKTCQKKSCRQKKSNVINYSWFSLTLSKNQPVLETPYMKIPKVNFKPNEAIIIHICGLSFLSATNRLVKTKLKIK